MRTGISISVSIADLRRLAAIVADPNTPQKHVWRTRIILLTADGVGTAAIMAATGKSKTCVWRWQERFMEAGVDGLLRDRTRPPGKAPIAGDRVAEVVRLTLAPPKRRGDTSVSGSTVHGKRACRFGHADPSIWTCGWGDDGQLGHDRLLPTRLGPEAFGGLPVVLVAD